MCVHIQMWADMQRMQEAEKCSTSQGIFCSQTVPVPLCMSALENGWLPCPFQVVGERKNRRALPWWALAMALQSSCWDTGKSLKHWLATWLNYNLPVASQTLWWSCLLGGLGCSAVLVLGLWNSKGRIKANSLCTKQRTGKVWGK